MPEKEARIRGERRKSGAPPSERSSRRIAWYCAGFEIRCPRDSGVQISPTAPFLTTQHAGKTSQTPPALMGVCAGVCSPFASSSASALLAAWGLPPQIGAAVMARWTSTSPWKARRFAQRLRATCGRSATSNRWAAHPGATVARWPLDRVSRSPSRATWPRANSTTPTTPPPVPKGCHQR